MKDLTAGWETSQILGQPSFLDKQTESKDWKKNVRRWAFHNLDCNHSYLISWHLIRVSALHKLPNAYLLAISPSATSESQLYNFLCCERLSAHHQTGFAIFQHLIYQITLKLLKNVCLKLLNFEKVRMLFSEYN